MTPDEVYRAYVDACRKHMYDGLLTLYDEGKINHAGAKRMILDLLPKIYNGTYHDPR